MGRRIITNARHITAAVAFLIVAGFPGSLPAGAAEPEDGVLPPNSADRLIFWTKCADLLELTDVDLGIWAQRGVTAFSCNTQWLRGLGGRYRFSPDLTDIAGPRFELQRSIVDSRIVERAGDLGIDLYLGVYFANSTNPRTPLAGWFDNREWSRTVLPRIGDLAAAARTMGFVGLAFDQELYPQADGRQTASWNWDFPSNTHNETAVRDQVRRRGQQVMQSVVNAFPGLKILAYASQFPETWDEVVQAEVNGVNDAHQDAVHIDLWDGLTGVDGYDSIRFLSVIFYKTTHVSGASWDDAFAYHYNSLFSMFSRRLSNWDQAADKIVESPFVWISAGSTRFEAAKDPDDVAEQLAAARRWGMDRVFVNYTYDTLHTFDYEPYVPGIRAATSPGIVDRTAPRLSVERPTANGNGISRIRGTASDDFAVRVICWETDDGQHGAARTTWRGSGDVADGSTGQTRWKVRFGGDARNITIEAEDIHGLTTMRVVELR